MLQNQGKTRKQLERQRISTGRPLRRVFVGLKKKGNAKLGVI